MEQVRERLQESTGKRLLFPEATQLSDVAEYVGPFVHGEDDFQATPTMVAGNTLSQFAWVDLSQTGGPKHATIRLQATDATVRALAQSVVTDDDSLSWQLISHKGSGLTLVIVNHSAIIGSRWVAYVETGPVLELVK